MCQKGAGTEMHLYSVWFANLIAKPVHAQNVHTENLQAKNMRPENESHHNIQE